VIVLLVIDMQVGLFTGAPRHDADGVVGRINALGRVVRQSGGLVIFIQHDGVPLPGQAAADAAHMAVAACHGVDVVLTWNVAHIANAILRRRVEDICRAAGYEAPILCTPDELMEDCNG